jgi:hypothetical protein
VLRDWRQDYYDPRSSRVIGIKRIWRRSWRGSWRNLVKIRTNSTVLWAFVVAENRRWRWWRRETHFLSVCVDLRTSRHREKKRPNDTRKKPDAERKAERDREIWWGPTYLNPFRGCFFVHQLWSHHRIVDHDFFGFRALLFFGGVLCSWWGSTFFLSFFLSYVKIVQTFFPTWSSLPLKSSWATGVLPLIQESMSIPMHP